jgi:folate-binding protein YgfZ
VATTIETHAADPVEYAAATGGVGWYDRSAQGKLAVSGPDATAYLDALLSNDIAAIPEGGGGDATLLTPKGRMLAEVRVLRTADELLLDTERVALQALFDALTQFRIGYRAELHKRTLERALYSLVGPRADSVVQEPPPAEEHGHVLTSVGGVSVRAIRTRLGVDLLFDSSALDEVRRALEGAGAVPLSEATAELLRIEAGIPRFGVEIDAATMPQEASLHERAVSYSKGCYIGQETVARLYWKGKPNRVLRGLLLSTPVEPGTALLLGESEVGKLSAVALSPRLGPIALALIRVEAEPGATLSFAGADGSATIVAPPFRIPADARPDR